MRNRAILGGMKAVFEFVAERPVLVVFLVVGIGSALGRIRVAGISLGAVGVLFASMGLTAWGVALGVTVELPAFIGDLGLALFAFCVGLIAGPGFGAALRSAYPLLLVVTGFLVVAAGTAFLVGRSMGISALTIAGTFAGAVTSTPALAATGGSPEATVGYASAYVYGTVGAMVAVGLALRYRGSDTDTPAQLIERAVRIDHAKTGTVGELIAAYGNAITISRMRPKGGGDMVTVGPESALPVGAVINIVGPKDVVDRVSADFGHTSTIDIVHDHSKLDFRRIILSNPALAGRQIGDLGLREKYGATIARVRRGDVEFVGSGGVVLHQGDRLRVVGPKDAMSKLTALFGDSERGIADINPAVLGLGLAAGLGLGTIAIPLPGGSSFALGAAAGTLVLGLIMGRIGRIGPIVTSLPHTAAGVLSELGLVLFLAFAGTKAGSLIVSAIVSGEIVNLLLLGAIMTTILMAGVFLVARHVFHSGGTRLAGVMAGTQTNPAILAFANERTGYDTRVALAYSLIYPAAMVVKILIAQVLVTL